MLVLLFCKWELFQLWIIGLGTTLMVNYQKWHLIIFRKKSLVNLSILGIAEDTKKSGRRFPLSVMHIALFSAYNNKWILFALVLQMGKWISDSLTMLYNAS